MALAREGKGKLLMKVIDADTKSGSINITGPVRLSYMSVFKARKNKKRQNQLEYSLVAMFEKDDLEQLKFVRERINHALTKKFGKVIPKFETCLLDGDIEVNEKGEPMYPGFMFIATRADLDQPPLLYSPTRVLLDASNAIEWVSGDWGYVKLDFFGYDNENKGVSTRLKAVQFAAKDTPYGKGPVDPDQVRDEFEDVTAGTTGGFLD